MADKILNKLSNKLAPFGAKKEILFGADPTKYAQGVNVSAFLDVEIAEQLRSATVMLGKTHVADFQKGSDSKTLRKRGSLTATTATEATDHTRSQYSQSTLNTLQVAEIKVYVEFSDKARDFSSMTIDEIAEEATKAVADKVDIDALALFDGFSTSVGSTGVDLTPQVLRTATYKLRLNEVPGPYIFVLHPTQIDDVLDDIQTSSAAIWGGNNVQLSILNGESVTDKMGYAGTYLEIDVYSSTNIESINSAADWSGACLNPMRALAFGDDGRGIRTEFDRNIKAGVTELSVNMYYDWKEFEDLAGCSIVSDQ